MTRSTKIALKYGLPILILLLAGGFTARLISQREPPAREEVEAKPVLVEASTVQRKEHRLDVRASGTVIPARQTTVQPQVAGRVVWVNDSLVPGGVVKEGERLVQIDRSDYQLALEQQQNALEQARAQLAIEKGQQDVAKREWELFKKQAEEVVDPESDPSLALRKPQLESARAQVEAAKSRVKRAKLDLQRTRVDAPFDAFVRDESAEIGQLAGTQSQLATLVSTDAFWIRLSIPTGTIKRIDIPGVNADEGAEATIHHTVDGETIERRGQVIRLLGDLDPAGRMARILVEIKDPLGLAEMQKNDEDLRGVPLLLDSYVDVRIEGNTTEKLIEIPRRSVHNGNETYVIRDGKLAIEQIEIAWRRPNTVLVRSGIDDGATIVTGPLPQPVEGMPLEPAAQTKPEDT